MAPPSSGGVSGAESVSISDTPSRVAFVSDELRTLGADHHAGEGAGSFLLARNRINSSATFDDRSVSSKLSGAAYRG